MTERLILKDAHIVKDYVFNKIFAYSTLSYSSCRELSHHITEEILCNILIVDNLRVENQELKDKIERIQEIVKKLNYEVE